MSDSTTFAIPTLHTDRLTLRAWRQSDIDTYSAWLADEETVRYIGGKVMDRQEAWRSMAAMAGSFILRGFGFWAVDERSTGALVGRLGLWFPDGWPAVEVGWLIGQAHRRRGYAAEAARASARYAFEELRLPSLISVIHEDNVASKAVAQAIGERFDRKQTVRGFPCEIWQMERE
jgi:RimJ/RimL family protein N-acetyltransferase